MNQTTRPLLGFHRDQGPDDRGRTLRAILAQDDRWLEATHDFIQWLFPLAERSGANPGAPVLDPATVSAFVAEPGLRASVRASLQRMLRFYGLQLESGRPGDSITLAPGPNWAARRSNWFDRDTHNSLRLTRMIRSLAALGLADEARALQQGLLRLCDAEPGCGIGERTRGYWRRALDGAAPHRT